MYLDIGLANLQSENRKLLKIYKTVVVIVTGRIFIGSVEIYFKNGGITAEFLTVIPCMVDRPDFN